MQQKANPNQRRVLASVVRFIKNADIRLSRPSEMDEKRKWCQQNNNEMSWSGFWQVPWRRWYLVISVVTLVIANYCFAEVFVFVANRHGAVLFDPVLALFDPIDNSVAISLVLYSSMGLYFSDQLFRPRALLAGNHSLFLVISIRAITLLLTPLEAPPKVIPLGDPVLRLLFHTSTDYTKDLFFSGHTATTTLMCLNARGWRRNVLLLSTLLVATGVLLQHAHYTVDVVGAPFIAFTCYKIAVWFDAIMPYKVCSKVCIH
ncbi:expressed unknown protein [Seminavis robusta]|uniref:Sphingomyelin synthase-like domain-containing protein n=1 Tax=Seminavis robusta TaxID=568900 RepID=A0A9N8H695_9STRA|nr:expressed unknown protein [Seminavis robusta]|eukprot:Sro106_g053430.1 n/a (260) ;mRNA; r:13151-13930